MRTLLCVLIVSLVGCDGLVRTNPVVGPIVELESEKFGPVREPFKIVHNPQLVEPLPEVPREERGKKLLSQLATLNTTDSAAALQQTDRSIQREPEYETKPKYCFLVLGPKQEKRVLLVIDGLTLYADKNCDGVLNPTNEKFKLTLNNEDPAEFQKFHVTDGDDSYEVEVSLWHWLLAFHNGDKDAEEEISQSISVRTSDGLRFIAWGDHQLGLRFHPSPDEAPIVHVGGPLQMGFEMREPVRLERERALNGNYEISAAIGTFGVGPGSFASLAYNVIPPNDQPQVMITIASNDEPTVLETALDLRC